MCSPHRAAACAAATLLLLPAGASAQDTARSLGTVTVPGGTPTSLPTEIPTTVEGVTREQIARSINATDSEDALRYLPSLLVRKRYIGDYNHAVLSTRASGTGNPARSMVFADGILLSNFLGNGPANAPRWMLVLPEEIERADVLYGPFSAAYPGNSVGAVVDFTTRMPRGFEAFGKTGASRQSFRLYGTGEDYESRQAVVSVGNRQGDWSWRLSLQRSDSEGHPLTFATRLAGQGTPGAAGTPVTGAVPGLNRSNQPWLLLGAGTQYRTRQDVAKLRVAHELTPTVRATYTFGRWDNDARARSQSYLRDAAGNPVYSGTVAIGGRGYTLSPTDFGLSNEDLTHLMHGLTLKSHTRGTWDWELTASHYDYDRDTLRAATTAQPAAQAGGPGRIVDQSGTGWTTLAARGVWRPEGPQGAHIVEAGLQRDRYRLRSVENATADWIAGAPGTATAAFRGDTTLTSLWAQDSWRFAPGWKTVLGLRLEEWHAFDGATSNASTTVRQGERRETHASPKAALSWQWDERWTLKASTGRAVRMPTVSELYQGGIDARGVLTNNDPGLRPEISWTTELSAERDLGDGQGLLRLTAFFERTRDALYAQTNTTVTPNVTNIQNVDRIRTHGLEAAWQRADAYMKGLDLQSSLTWADSEIVRNDNFPASVGRWQPRVPRWRAGALASWRIDARWSASLGARYAGRQYNTLDNSDANGFTYQGASRFFTTDLRIRWQAGRQVSAAFGIDNLNNYTYWNFHPYPQRSFHAELKLEL